MAGFKKNTAGQKWLVFAFDRTDNSPKTGNAAVITGKIRKDYGTATAIADTNPTEIEDGYYEFDLTAGETDGDVLDILPESSTADIQVIGSPARVFTWGSGRSEIDHAPYLGDFLEDSAVYFAFDSTTDDGSSITLGTDGAIEVHRNNSAITTNGITFTEDANGDTGVHYVNIDLTHADFIAQDDYTIRLVGAAVNEKTINRTLAHFSIENRAATNVFNGTVDANVKEFLGAAIAETTAGRIAGNFDTFFENADSATTKTVDDVGSATVAGSLNANVTHIMGTALAETTAGNLALNFAEFFDNDDAITTKTVDDVGTATVASVVSANVTEFLGTAITENTAGRIAGNFDTFFENGDIATTKTVDDVGTAPPTGTVNANVIEIKGTALAETSAGNIAANFDNFFDNNDTISTRVLDHIGDLTKILGTAIIETSAGRIAANFDEFFDNNDAQTTKVVDNVGVGGTVTANLTQVLGTTLAETTAGNIAANFDEFFDNDDAITTVVVDDIALINTGTGARSVTITVEDVGTNPLENVTVRMSEGSNTFVLTTNASGVAQFALDDATYDVYVTKPGYTAQITTRVVNGTETQTYNLVVNNITAPTGPTLSTGVMTVLDELGVAEVGIDIHMQIFEGTGTAGYGYDSKIRTVTSVSAGYVEFTGLVRGAKYKVWRGPSPTGSGSGLNVSGAGAKVEFTVPNSASFNIDEVIGADA